MQLIECEMVRDGFAQNPGINVTWVLGVLGRKFPNSLLNQSGIVKLTGRGRSTSSVE